MGHTAPTKPAPGVEPDLRGGRVWCPYCADSLEYVWDAALRIARCPGCGISTRDFHVRNLNRLRGEAEWRQFDEAVRRSGRRWLPGRRRMVSQVVLHLPTPPGD